MSVVHLLFEAEQELEVAALHYESQQAGLGAALLTEVEKTFGRISELPLAARAVRGDLRRRFVHRFPYYVLYRVRGHDILVVAVAHRRRRPGYWRDRQ